MFGDIAHGSILMLFGLCLMFLRAHMPQQYTKMLVPHRYMIFLMGFFSTYCGFIYNDFMSISLNLFGSCYNINAAIPDSAIIRISN
jgi:V-type H+-transporting ATPase subunit a